MISAHLLFVRGSHRKYTDVLFVVSFVFHWIFKENDLFELFVFIFISCKQFTRNIRNIVLFKKNIEGFLENDLNDINTRMKSDYFRFFICAAKSSCIACRMPTNFYLLWIMFRCDALTNHGVERNHFSHLIFYLD